MTAADSTTTQLEVPDEAGFEARIDDAVATITLNRPDRLNAQTPHTWEWLARVGNDLPGTVRVILVRGAGRAFSAGLDRQMFTPEGIPGIPGILALGRGSEADCSARIQAWQRGFGWLARPDIVSVAAVQGHAIGGGFQLALACDIRVLADDVQFCMAEPKLGIVPDLGGTRRLVELVGYSRAVEICLTGRRVDGTEAMAMGLGSALVPVDHLDHAVRTTVDALLAVNRDAAVETKALLLRAAQRTQDEAEAAEREAQYRRLSDIAGHVRED